MYPFTSCPRTVDFMATERKRKFTCAHRVMLINISVSSHFHLNVSIKSIPLEIKRHTEHIDREFVGILKHCFCSYCTFFFYKRGMKKMLHLKSLSPRFFFSMQRFFKFFFYCEVLIFFVGVEYFENSHSL